VEEKVLGYDHWCFFETAEGDKVSFSCGEVYVVEFDHGFIGLLGSCRLLLPLLVASM